MHVPRGVEEELREHRATQEVRPACRASPLRVAGRAVLAPRVVALILERTPCAASSTT
ncbi:hypothetical protein ACFQZC_06815 [Streptacidiphilus monticola]